MVIVLRRRDDHIDWEEALRDSVARSHELPIDVEVDATISPDPHDHGARTMREARSSSTPHSDAAATPTSLALKIVRPRGCIVPSHLVPVAIIARAQPEMLVVWVVAGELETGWKIG